MALSLPGGNLPSGFDRASAYHESCGEIQNAFDLAERGLALYPLDGRLRLRTGLLSAQLGQPERAVTDLAQVLRQSPDQSIETYAGFAEAAEQTQSHKLCAEILASVIDRVGTRAEPDHDALLRALAGRALRKAGRPAEARALLTEAVGSGNSLPDWARWELQHASWQDTAPPIAPGPGQLQADVDRFRHVVTTVLGTGNPAEYDLPSGQFTPHTLALQWIQTRVRVLDAANLDDGTRRQLVEQYGLADGFIRLLAKGASAVAEECLQLCADLSFHSRHDLPNRIKDAAATITLKGKPVLCPYTMTRCTTRDNLARGMFVHRHGGRVCVIIQSMAWEIIENAQDSCWFFPQHELILYVARGERQFGDHAKLSRAIAGALATLFNRRHLYPAYLKSEARLLTVAEMPIAHIGHTLWNVLSGWPRLFSAVDPRNIDHLAINNHLQYFGGVGELYPDVVSAVPGGLLNIDRETDIFDLIYQKHALLIDIRDDFVTEDLAQRIIAWARRQAAPEFMRNVVALQQRTYPLLLITIRLDNRCWLEQEQGYINMVRKLAEDFPRLGVVIDGMNAEAHSGSTHGLMSLDAERALADRIAGSVQDTAVVWNSVGCAIAESVALSAVIDAFVAPVGAGMTKYRWITNKPGVAFTNSLFMSPGSLGGRLYDNPSFRETPVPAMFVDREAITDVGGAQHGLAHRTNFSMDWHAAYFTTRELLAALNFEPGHSRSDRAAPDPGRSEYAGH